MNVSRFALVLGLSLSAFACSSSSEDGSSSEAAQTVAPSPTIAVSSDGLGAVGTMLQQARFFMSEPASEYAAPYKAWIEAQNSAVHIEARGSEGVTYYFTGDVLVEGDIIDHTVQLVVKETYGGEWGPTYEARIGDGQVPDTAHRLEGADLEAFQAIEGLARLASLVPDAAAAVEFREFAAPWSYLDRIEVQHSSPAITQFWLSAGIVEGGDIIVGNASLHVTANANWSPEFETVNYSASATVVNPFPKD